MLNKNLPHIKGYNDENYEENYRHLEKVTKREIVIFLKIGFLRQRTSKTEPKWKSYVFL